MAVIKFKKFKITVSDCISIIALLVSMISIYYSVFFKEQRLTISVINSVNFYSTALRIKFLMYNPGNIPFTILGTALFVTPENKEVSDVNLSSYLTNPIQYFDINHPTERIFSPNEQMSAVGTIYNTSYDELLKSEKKANVVMLVSFLSDGLPIHRRFHIGHLMNKDGILTAKIHDQVIQIE